MKKIVMILICISLSAFAVTGCGKSDKKTETTASESANVDAEQLPSIDRVRNICELATLECYYHNVAKSTKTRGTGLLNFGEKDRKFWLEYDGIARLGVKMSDVTMDISEDTITIKLPEAEILSMKVDENSLTDNSYISDKDSIFFKNKITAEDQTQAINDAQEEMKETILANESLMLSARERAQKLIENYINSLGEITGVKYTINWETAVSANSAS